MTLRARLLSYWFPSSAWEPTRGKLCFLIMAAVLMFSPAVSRAQSFGFSISSGGHGHHHGHHHHHHHRGGWAFGYHAGPYWGPGWWGPPPVVYAAPAVVQPSVVYVQPAPVVTTPPPPAVSPYSSTTPSATRTLAANTVPSVAASSSGDDRIVIRNMAGAQLPVSFVVDSQDVELADGAVRTFVGKTHRTVQYDRGGRFGSTQQEITGGQYEFRITATGWDLVRKADAFTSRTAVRSNSLPESGVSR
jgi:hypothetical protein